MSFDFCNLHVFAHMNFSIMSNHEMCEDTCILEDIVLQLCNVENSRGIVATIIMVNYNKTRKTTLEFKCQ